MRKIFTFLVSFLTVMSGAVWGQSGSGTQEDPWIINLNDPQDIGDVGSGSGNNIVDWHGNNQRSDNLIEIKRTGYYELIGDKSETTDRIWIRATGDVYMTMKNVNIEAKGLGHKKGRPFALVPKTNLFLTLAPGSVNRVTSERGDQGEDAAAAIFLPENSHLTVTEDSEKGALYATGFVGIGAAQNNDTYGTCGQLDLKGGTVVISGSEYGVGGKAPDGHQPFTVEGNTFLIIDGPLVASQKYCPNKGIIYLDDMGDEAATVYGDVTLSSEYPEAGDGVTYDLQIDEEGHLTLGSGVQMPVARLVEGSEDRLKAYKINWDPNEAGTDHVGGGNAPEAYYYGGDIEVTKGILYTCGQDKHEQVGWLLNNETEARVSYTTDKANPDKLIELTLGAVWIDKTRTIVGNIEEPLTGEPTLNVYPAKVNNVTFTPAGELPKGLEYKDGIFSGQATSAGKSQVAFNVSIGGSPIDEKATQVTFDIAQNKNRVIDVTKGKVTGTWEYSGAVSNQTIKDDYIKVFDTNGSQLTHVYYDYTCDFTPASGTSLKAAKSVNTIKDAGTYSNFVITPKADMNVSLSDEGTSFTLEGTIIVTPKAITGIKAADQEIELGGTVKTDAAQNPEIVTVAGLIPGEEAVFTSGTIQVDANTNVAGVYKNALTIQSLEVAESNSQTGFLKNNYSNWENFTTSTYGKGTLTVTDAQDPINYYNIYNETTYDFIDVSFSRNVVREGGSVNVYLEIPEGLDPAAVTLMFKRGMYGYWENLNTDDDGNYPIRNIWTDIYVKAVVDESYIDPNPDENHIYIDLSETNDSIWLYTDNKLVEEGKTAVIQAEVAKSCQNKEIRYMYKRTVLGEWKEMPKDYSINQYVVRDITTDIYVKAYFVFDKQDPTTAKNPHHVYADITATCEGLYLDATRHKVADEGDTKVFLYVKKGFETKDARYLFKRGLKGEWEDLVPGIEQNTFQVTDIEGDIYLKGIDAIYTGTEDIDGMVRVYTKDGSLFVYTAQPEEISVVSMTGVTVKRTRQTGLQSYPLNQGIYVVRVGEQVFKVRVK